MRSGLGSGRSGRPGHPGVRASGVRGRQSRVRAGWGALAGRPARMRAGKPAMAGRAARAAELAACLPARRQTLRSSSIRESDLVRAARYAPRRSRSRAGRPPGHRRRPAFMRAPARPHAALLDATLFCWTARWPNALPLLHARLAERAGLLWGGEVVPAVPRRWCASPQAVCGVGPHEGVAPGRLVPASQRGYGSAQRVSSRAYVSARKTCPSLELHRARRTPDELFCGRRRDQSSRFAGALARRTPPQRARTAHRLGRRGRGQCCTQRQRQSGPQAAFLPTPTQSPTNERSRKDGIRASRYRACSTTPRRSRTARGSAPG
jgi:hypothetical protein